MQSKKCLWVWKKKNKINNRKLYHQSRRLLRKQISQIKIRLELIAHSIVPMLLYWNTSAFRLFLSGRMNFFNFWSLVWIRRMNVEALIKSSGLRNDAVQCASFIFIIFKLKTICQKRWRQPSKDNKICRPTKVTFLMAD